MMGNKAWQRHGCYHLGSEQYYNFPVQRSSLGCHDDWNSLDHFDPTTDSYRLFKHFLHLRSHYPVLQDSFGLGPLSKWSYDIQLPGSNKTETEMGLWTAERYPYTTQNLTGSQNVMLMYMNENVTTTYKGDCTGSHPMNTSWASGTTLRNLIYPFEKVETIPSRQAFASGFRGCIDGITFPPYGFKLFVPEDEWTGPVPQITRFVPGHDARIQAEQGDTNATTVDIQIEFNVEMSCDSVTNAVKLGMASSGHGGTPTIGSHSCAKVTDAEQSDVVGVEPSAWYWKATLTNVPDGVLQITVGSAQVEGGNDQTNVRVFSAYLTR